MAKKSAGKTMTTRKQYTDDTAKSRSSKRETVDNSAKRPSSMKGTVDDSAKRPASMRVGKIVTVEKRPSGREIWHVEGKTYIASSSSTAAMDQSVKKFRKTLKRLAKQ
mgnify:CR=1 FL=1